MMEVELRVRPVTRYSLTRWHSGPNGAGIETLGEFDSEMAAERALQAFGHLEAAPPPSVLPLMEDCSIRFESDDPPSHSYPVSQETSP